MHLRYYRLLRGGNVMRKIVSHLPPRHLDDFLSLALLKEKYPEAEVEFVHPQSVPSEYFTDRNVVLVDVGGTYEPEFRNYDHHHDLSVPCSLVLVLSHEFGGRFVEHPVVQFIDLADRRGFKTASQKFSVKPSREIDEKRKTILLADVTKYPHEVAEAFRNALLKTKDYDEFVESTYSELDGVGVLEEAKERLRKEEEEFRRKLEKARVVERGLKVVVSDETLAPYHGRVFSELGADVIVERNSMNPLHTSVIKNTSKNGTKNLNLREVTKDFPVVFEHRSGFIVVLDEPFEEVAEVITERLTTRVPRRTKAPSP